MFHTSISNKFINKNLFKLFRNKGDRWYREASASAGIALIRENYLSNRLLLVHLQPFGNYFSVRCPVMVFLSFEYCVTDK